MYDYMRALQVRFDRQAHGELEKLTGSTPSNRRPRSVPSVSRNEPRSDNASSDGAKSR